MVLVSLLSAGLAAGGTYGLLAAGGYLVKPGAVVNPTPRVELTNTPEFSENTAQGAASAITDAARLTGPAVVTITSRSEATGIEDPFSLPTTGVGSGIIYDGNGLAVTNRHVVCGADALTVKLADGREFEARVYGIDTLTDLAIVQLDGADSLPVAQLGDSNAIQPGQLAVAIGSPLGTFTNSITSGVISAMGREISVDDPCRSGTDVRLSSLIQTDAAINPGNSGGALIDGVGAVVGVNTAVAGGAQGIGFAIPINIAKPIMDQASAGKDLTRPWLGVNYEAIDPALQDQLGLPIAYGAVVRRPIGRNEPAVVADSPAAQAGVKENDIITRINDVRIDAAHSLQDILSQYDPEQNLTLDILRGGEQIRLTVTLGTRPAYIS
jgi:S1-C subfamily serine protease